MTVQSRQERLAMPLARSAIRDLTLAAGGCLRPVHMRRTSTVTGETDYQMIPCGSTLEALCPPCAERARNLRAEQCRDGWHLEDEPEVTPLPLDQAQEFWLTARAEAQVRRDKAAAAGDDTTELDQLIGELDEELAAAGIRGSVTRTIRTGEDNADGHGSGRRSRSTRRRQDAPDLPRRPVSARTTGQVFTTADGKTYRPSMFLTLTLGSYGKVLDDGTPADPGSYDYQRAARDALHFAAIEPQRRLAPHAHIALRGAISRADLRRVIAATYHQVWWPSTAVIRHDDDDLPSWHEPTGCYLDPATGELLPTWDQALDAIGPHDEPLHVVRFGPKFDAQGVLAGSKDAGRCVRYLTKYLTKQIAGCHSAVTDAERAHAARLTEALRYGIQPKDPRPGLIPGLCKGKAHRYENLGYAGRRVLVSRRWSGKTLADHRADRKAWLMAVLDLPATESTQYRWQRVTPADPDFLPATDRLMHVLTDRTRWREALADAKRRAEHQSEPGSGSDRRAA